MTPSAFVSKWKGSPLSERAGAQQFFLDLCELLDVEKPTDLPFQPQASISQPAASFTVPSGIG